jgi:hypothetical protein
VFSSARIRRSTAALLGVSLAFGGAFWLVLLHHAQGGHERNEPGLLLHGLRDGALALPSVLPAVWLGAMLALGAVDRQARLPRQWRAALIAAGAAASAAVVLAVGSPVHAWLFDVRGAGGLPAGLHLGRDTLLALAATLPIAGLVMAALSARWDAAHRPGVAQATAPAPASAIPSARVTRRAFVAGAGGLAATGVAGAALTRSSPSARAVVPSDRLQLYVNEGHVPMVDGTMVYMRGFGQATAADPRPSLTIAPQIFLRDGGGPIASRFYPLLGEDHVPHEGCPDPAAIDPSGIGLHVIRRRHWASFFPRRTIIAETGSTIRLRITNRLAGPHTFTIAGVVSETLGPAGSSTATKDVDFPAPPAGTYVYQDATDAPVNRVLGLHGVLVVVPHVNPWTFDGTEGEFERQWLWILHDIDPEWGRRARLGTRIDPVATPSVPRYFTINDRSGVFSLAGSPDEAENRRTHEDTKPCGHGRRVDVRSFSDPSRGTGQLIRLVNTGIAVHQPHFHGNHVWTIAVDNTVFSRSTPGITADGHIQLQHWEDVVEMDPLNTKAVLLPIKPPPNALDEVLRDQKCDYVFPMHCHAEMSQTAGGGLYPGGMVSDWILKP